MALAGPRRVGANALLAAVLLGGALGVGAHELLPASADVGPAASVEVAGRVLERDVSAALRRSVVQVDAVGCGQERSATATIVEHSGKRLVLTNAHVVRGAGTAQVRTDDGATHSATVRGAVPGRDAVVLEFDDPSALPEGLRTASSSAGPGDVVVVSGFPGGQRVEMDATVRTVELRSGYGGTSPVLIVDAPADGGLSGGVVADAATGEVFGLVAARDPRTGETVAYPIAEVLDRGLGALPSC